MNRKEYRRVWMATQRAQAHGLNIKLALECYNQLRARGISAPEAREAILSAARDGLFGIMRYRGRQI